MSVTTSSGRCGAQEFVHLQTRPARPIHVSPSACLWRLSGKVQFSGVAGRSNADRSR